MYGVDLWFECWFIFHKSRYTKLNSLIHARCFLLFFEGCEKMTLSNKQPCNQAYFKLFCSYVKHKFTKIYALRRRYMAEILQIRRKTLFNQSFICLCINNAYYIKDALFIRKTCVKHVFKICGIFPVTQVMWKDHLVATFYS